MAAGVLVLSLTRKTQILHKLLLTAEDYSNAASYEVQNDHDSISDTGKNAYDHMLVKSFLRRAASYFQSYPLYKKLSAWKNYDVSKHAQSQLRRNSPHVYE